MDLWIVLYFLDNLAIDSDPKGIVSLYADNDKHVSIRQ